MKWRGWERPRAGHVYELEGPDPGAVGMAPAPRVGSSELSAEMAEVHALAILRDVPFSKICSGGGGAQRPAGRDLLNEMPFLSGQGVRSSTPHTVDAGGLNRFEHNRRFARTLSANGSLTPMNAFRGSTKGAHVGPYISRFMLIGATSLAWKGGGVSSFPGNLARWDLQDGFIPYGSVSIDQRTLTHRNCLDYMTDWCSWRDVQKGANAKGADQFEDKWRFVTTPRDLATYMHFDALHGPYLNACLILPAIGERIAIGILMEQAPTYGEPIATTFKSFDGDMVTISGEGGSCPSLSVMDRDGTPVLPTDWWLRHVPGAAFSEDL